MERHVKFIQTMALIAQQKGNPLTTNYAQAMAAGPAAVYAGRQSVYNKENKDDSNEFFVSGGGRNTAYDYVDGLGNIEDDDDLPEKKEVKKRLPRAGTLLTTPKARPQLPESDFDRKEHHAANTKFTPFGVHSLDVAPDLTPYPVDRAMERERMERDRTRDRRSRREHERDPDPYPLGYSASNMTGEDPYTTGVHHPYGNHPRHYRF